MKKPMKKTAKRATKAPTKIRVKRAAGKLGRALASTAAFAAGVARETEGMLRDLASNVTSQRVDDAAPRATDLLVHQHRRLEKLFERLESSKKDFEATLRELADDLSAHIAIEEKLFYPAVRKLKPDLILEGLEEHAMGRFALQRLLGTAASDASLQARLKALKELMTNHHHEEEHDLFTRVRRTMANKELEKLGAAMKKLFDAEVKRGHEVVLATFNDELHKPVHANSPQRPQPKTSKKAQKSAAAA
jgi:hemerythrin superfamily protein